MDNCYTDAETQWSKKEIIFLMLINKSKVSFMYIRIIILRTPTEL
jgi:hypothetical protein